MQPTPQKVSWWLAGPLEGRVYSVAPGPRQRRPHLRRLRWASQKAWVFDLLPGPRGLRGPREAPQGHPSGFWGLAGPSRKPPGPTKNQTKEPMSQEESIEQSSRTRDNKSAKKRKTAPQLGPPTLRLSRETYLAKFRAQGRGDFPGRLGEERGARPRLPFPGASQPYTRADQKLKGCPRVPNSCVP